jgi:hypothetical protein
MFTTVCLETLNGLEAHEERLNARGCTLLAWLRRRYPVRETFRLNDEFIVTKIPLWRG